MAGGNFHFSDSRKSPLSRFFGKMPECRFSDFSLFDLANLPILQLQLFQSLTYIKSCNRQEINLPALAVAIISITYKNDTLYTERIRQVLLLTLFYLMISIC